MPIWFRRSSAARGRLAGALGARGGRRQLRAGRRRRAPDQAISGLVSRSSEQSAGSRRVALRRWAAGQRCWCCAGSGRQWRAAREGDWPTVCASPGARAGRGPGGAQCGDAGGCAAAGLPRRGRPREPREPHAPAGTPLDPPRWHTACVHASSSVERPLGCGGCTRAPQSDQGVDLLLNPPPLPGRESPVHLHTVSSTPRKAGQPLAARPTPPPPAAAPHRLLQRRARRRRRACRAIARTHPASRACLLLAQPPPPPPPQQRCQLITRP